MQGFDVKIKSFPNHNYLYWARNQTEGDNIFGAIFRGSSVIRDDVGTLNLDAQSLDIISAQFYALGTGAVAYIPVLVGETLYTPSGASHGYERSFMLLTNAITGDSLDIKWFEPEKDSACPFLGGTPMKFFLWNPEEHGWSKQTDGAVILSCV